MGFSVNGQYLVIYNPDEVPRLLAAANVCKHKDYGSFQRQMCIYGWKRLAQNEMNKLVLTDGEAPGATVSQLGPSIKIMQHEVLVRSMQFAKQLILLKKADSTLCVSRNGTRPWTKCAPFRGKQSQKRPGLKMAELQQQPKLACPSMSTTHSIRPGKKHLRTSSNNRT